MYMMYLYWLVCGWCGTEYALQEDEVRGGGHFTAGGVIHTRVHSGAVATHQVHARY